MTRKKLTFTELKRMLPEQVDKLQNPVEFYCEIKKGKKMTILRKRKEWVGFGWIDLGDADGSEPTLVVDG